MIAEIIPEAYDAVGRQVSQSFFQRQAPHAALPIGRYMSQPLRVKCNSIHDVRRFLAGCRAALPVDLFGKKDHWQPPEEFEKLKKGACVDFSLWAWRQLLAMGYDARFVGGKHGRYGIGHAWVMFFQDGKCYLLEPQARTLGLRLPRLSTLAYQPTFSIGCNGDALKYYAHKQDPDLHSTWRLVLPLIPEWARIWGGFWLRFLVRFPYFLVRRLWRKAFGRTASSEQLQNPANTQL